ncbi:hypothetical protein FACS189434_13920 [Bacteroidia bacterium]|nr:hypothetical protein FACS189434_13920 [Bacteroidia bacterium]
MNKKILWATVVAAALLSSCKTDTEDDLKQMTSSVQGLYINEVFTSNPDWVELYNSSDAKMDLGGFILQDDKGAAEEYIIPANTTIAAKGFIVFENGSSFQFGLGSKGDKVILLDAERVKIDDISTPNFGEDKGKSYARIPNGSENWQTVNNPTKGMSN